MKRFKLLAGLLLSLLSGPVFALPHDNRSDVDSTVKVFIPWNEFGVTADGTSIYSLGSGAPRVAQVNSLGFAAIRYDAVSDAAHLLYQIPDNACVTVCPIKISVLWSTNSNTTTQTATWQATYSATALGEAFSAATTALDTTITSDSVLGTAYMMNETPQGVINANTLSRGDVLNLKINMSAVSGLNPASDIVLFHGVYIEYTREML